MTRTKPWKSPTERSKWFSTPATYTPIDSTTIQQKFSTISTIRIIIFFTTRSQEWYPFVSLNVPAEKDTDEEDDGLTENEIKNYISQCWKKEFRPFYNPQDFSQPVSEAETQKVESDITAEVSTGIANFVLSKNLEYKTKPLVTYILYSFYLDH